MEIDSSILTAIIPTLLVPAALYLLRNYIKAWIETGIQHKFNIKIEALRSELRNNEEGFKSEIRTNEAQISALRDGVLSGRANRQALVDERRIVAVERIWKAVVKLAPFKNISAAMAVLDIDVIIEELPNEPKLRHVFQDLIKIFPIEIDMDKADQAERVFISPLAWSLLAAYSAIVNQAFLLASFLATGVGDPLNLINTEKTKELLKTTLPHMSEYIDKYEFSGYHYLLDSIEEKLLMELRKILEGEEGDEASLKQSKKIIEKVASINEANNEAKLSLKKSGI